MVPGKSHTLYRRVAKELTGFSFLNLRTKKEDYKTPDHDMIQCTIRVTEHKAPPRQPSIRRVTLQQHGVWHQLRKLTKSAARAAEPPERGVQHTAFGMQPAECAVADLHEKITQVCLQHQRSVAKQHGKDKARTVAAIRTIEKKLAEHTELEDLGPTVRNLERYKRKLIRAEHKRRRMRDAQEAFEAQMVAAGRGKAQKPRTRPAPLTTIEGPLEEEAEPQTHTTQEGVVGAVTTFWRRYLQRRFEATGEAQRDRDEVLESVRRATVHSLPETLRDSLSVEQIIDPQNIRTAINNLQRGSKEGVDGIPPEFYIDHQEEIAPLLSMLYRELLQKGSLTETMRQAILSPIFKEKGDRSDPAMYRPISVTTIEYRILARCIAQKLNNAIAYLIADPQVGFSPTRQYDENISLVRSTIRDINERRSLDGGIMLFLDNEKAFDRVQHDFMYKVLEAFNLPSELVGAVKTLYREANTAVKVNGQIGRAFAQTSGVKQGCPLSAVLYILVQEIQLRMIRESDEVRGIPIPDHDGRDPKDAHSADGTESEMCERGLVDDTMVALRTPADVPALLEILARFEAFSGHRI